MKPVRRLELGLFLASWIAFAFFHQGGGWNQNIRFAMVRAMVEEGRFTVDSFLFYSAVEDTDRGPRLVRTPMVEGGFTFRDREFVVAWNDASGQRVSVRGDADEANLAHLSRMAASADVAYARGHFHPNKAPGTAFLALPGYFLVYHVERLLGLDPDDWWILTLNAWLTSALSVGLVSALGCVLFFRVARLLWGGSNFAPFLATLSFAFGTMFFPYATMLYEHNVEAVALLASFYFLGRGQQRPDGRSRADLVCGGLAAGMAAITSYLAAVPVLFLIAYLLYDRSRKDGWLWFGLGLLGPFLLVSFYNQVCFGTPFTTNYHFQNPQFVEGGTTFLRVLQAPHLGRIPILLFSPFRGLFFSSPVLLLGVVGLVQMWRGGSRRPEVVLFSAIVGFFLLFNISFNGWHGGWAAAPRYLAPVLPFVALPVTYGFVRYFRTTSVLAAASVMTMGLVTVVDPQTPVGVASIARHPGRATWLRSPVLEYDAPLFFTGLARPILNAQLDDRVRRRVEELAEAGASPEEQKTERAALRERLEDSLRRSGDSFALVQWSGTVSVNPIGAYESWVGRGFPRGAEEWQWNSFNAGEFLFPDSRLSLLPLLLVCLPLLVFTLDTAKRLDRHDP